jgi:hypothetical protein
MCLTIDELSQRSSSRGRTPHATPARSGHTGVGPLHATLVAAGLAPCARVTSGGDGDSGSPDSRRCLAGDGIGAGAPCQPRPSRPQPRDLVSSSRQPDALGHTPLAAGGSRGSHDPGRRGRGACGRCPFSPPYPTCRPRQRQSWHGSSGAGRSRSRVKRVEPSWG